MRSPISITFSVWRAIFLREALDRLFGERAAWFWLLVEPMLHIAFLGWIWTVVRVHRMGGIDVLIWLMVGLLAFFLFRRTAIQVMYAIDCNRALFAYRQVKPFDPALVRGGLEAFLMVVVATLTLLAAGLLGHDVFPGDPLLVLASAFGLWLLGMGYGLIASVLMELVPESEHILNILMLPLYLISGVIWPISTVPGQWREVLMLNPIAHGLESVRQGFVPYYHAAPETSLAYLYIFAIVQIFIGMLLYRRFALRLVMQ
ncbi:ABC transporter permease [Bordetella hinzii]|nr:ABC transporter permease [Bordetella hinzii]AKQ57180.1 Polysialic acid transport protein KpsM [Bordetella hinzii]AKQ61648.1 Polysialic acid transport protein KpsM [Bordetella hinzii]KCB30427.1 ABC transporter, ATP-binding protein [Bordetella hinzii CA90 BAL1384]SNV65350.1 permease of an ABC exporter involved in polysaccharide export [Bordetella hinzii]